MNNQGIFTISIDTELAWGVCDKSINDSARQAILKEREIIKRLLGLFKKYNIQATWAIVGHLFLEKCKYQISKSHPQIPQNNNHPDYALWYGQDIIEWIKKSSPRQGIASHSFHHPIYDEKKSDKNTIKEDIQQAKELHQKFNLAFDTFIFPRNLVGYKDLLAKAGIQVYRGKTKHWYDKISIKLIRRLLNLTYFLLAIPSKTVIAEIDEYNMVNISDSMLLAGRNGIRKIVPAQNLIKTAKKGLEQAVAQNKIFHLWFHPSNFAFKTHKQFNVLESILKYACQLRDKNKLKILTMSEIAQEVKNNQLTLATKEIDWHNQVAQSFFKTEYQKMKQDKYGTSFAYGRKKLEQTLDKVLQKLPKSSQVLDIGCGTGEQIKKCHNLGLKVTGLEPAAQMRLQAQKLNPNVLIKDGLITKLPFENNSFDFIMAIEVLRYLKNEHIQKAYQEMLRVLKPGGQIFLSMVNRYALDGFYIYYQLKKPDVHCEFVSPRQVQRDLTKAGFGHIVSYGRMLAPLRFVYRINNKLGASLAKFSEPLDNLLAQQKWYAPLAGHLIVIATKPKN